MAKCQCPSCDLWFSSVIGFDRHRVGTYEPLARRCLTAEEMTAIGMRQNRHGHWVGFPQSKDETDRLRKADKG